MSPPKITSAEVLNENFIKVVFANGEFKKFNINLVTSRPNYDALKNYSFLKKLKVDSSGYSVYWNDDVDLCENELWLQGETVL
jgi:hypothetical protein